MNTTLVTYLYSPYTAINNIAISPLRVTLTACSMGLNILDFLFFSPPKTNNLPLNNKVGYPNPIVTVQLLKKHFLFTSDIKRSIVTAAGV